ncbi:MAG TPA: hypothetical protein VKA10_09365 [Prolixibacteraceae bacterium]|nr:hypothetical protein [Prolixibacteraceae bacterium]
MENKKLVKILQRDMNELGELISDVKNQGSFNALEMDFIHTRAKGLMQLVQLIKVDDGNGSEQVRVQAETLNEIKETVAEIEEEVVEETTPEPVQISEEKIAEISEEPEEDQKEEPVPVENETEEVGSQEQQVEAESKDEESIQAEKEDDEMLEEETEKSEANSRLGDSFLKGKSVNDLVTDQNKLEFKLSNRPVGSIKSAIGINDRFQYIRELFDGSSEKFAEAVTELDSKNNLKEAVEYLRTNFKWKKNETSLKFVNLVKRRFQDE